MKGERTEEAHYYDHQNVGAWIVLGVLPEVSIDLNGNWWLKRKINAY